MKTIGFRSIKEQGAFAAKRGQRQQDCPYPATSSAAAEWRQGFDGARQAQGSV